MLAEPNKKSLSERDIRLRLNGFLKHELDRTAHSAELLPELEYVHPDGRVDASCTVPCYEGMEIPHYLKEKLWDKYYTVAPARLRQSVGQSKIVKRA